MISMILITGCETIQKKEEGPLKVGLLLMSSPDDMYSEGYYGYYALKAIEKKYGVEIAYNDNVTNEKNAAFLLNSYGKKEYDIVIAIGGMFQKPMLDVASSYDGTSFVCIGGDVSRENVVSYVLPADEIGTVIGVISAGYNLNKSNNIAYVQSENDIAYYEGFLKGVKSINSQTNVEKFIFKNQDTYTGLIDKFKGKSIGLAGIMFYSPRLEKSLTDRKYSFISLGGGENETEIPRVIINYDVIFEMVYQNLMKENINEKNINLSLEDNILSVYSIDLIDSNARIKVEALMPKGN